MTVFKFINIFLLSILLNFSIPSSKILIECNNNNIEFIADESLLDTNLCLNYGGFNRVKNIDGSEINKIEKETDITSLILIIGSNLALVGVITFIILNSLK